MTTGAIGQGLPRHDALAQVLGQVEYADDLRFPDLVHARVLRSPHPHARIRSIDTAGALAQPGVLAVITHRDVPHNRYGPTHEDQPVLCDDKVRCVGDPVAVVAATDARQAEAALAQIAVEYEPLPPVLSPEQAVDPAAPLVHEGGNIAGYVPVRRGDVGAGFRAADLVVENLYRTQNVEHCHLETHAATGVVDAGGKVTIWTSVSRPYVVAQDLAKVLKLPLSRIRVVPSAVGGSFGGKNDMSIEPLVALLAMRVRRPVRLVLSRREEFTSSTVRHAFVMRLRSGVMRDGTLVAREVDLLCDTGAYVALGGVTLGKAALHAAGPYRIPHVRIDAFLVYTTKIVGGAMRGFGVPQVTFGYECHTDAIARRLGMDPAALRRKNGLRDGEPMATGQALPRFRVLDTLDRALAVAGWHPTEGSDRR